jgi:hypothetical protein
MSAGPFSKQAIYRGQPLNANNANDTVIGGALSVAPANSNLGSQFWQTIPGDRIILDPATALAYQQSGNNNNLYTGTYRYVQCANATSTPAKGHAAFWIPIAFNNNQEAQDALYQVTSDELANYGVTLFAGVYINTPGKGNNNVYWWIQESGKATCSFRNAITGTAAIGQGVYLAAAGNNNNSIDIGAFDQFGGANSAAIFTANSTTAYNTIDNFMLRYVGVAEQLPANNNLAAVDLVFKNGAFRW